MCGPASDRMRRWPRSWRTRRRGAAGSSSRCRGARWSTRRAGGRAVARPRVEREHERPRLEQRVRRIDRPAAREERDLGGGWDAERVAQLGVGVGGRREDRACLPCPARARPQYSGPDEDDVREGSQEAHEEAVGIALAGHEGVGVGHSRVSRRPRRASPRSSRTGRARRTRARLRAAAPARRAAPCRGALGLEEDVKRLDRRGLVTTRTSRARARSRRPARAAAAAPPAPTASSKRGLGPWSATIAASSPRCRANGRRDRVQPGLALPVAVAQPRLRTRSSSACERAGSVIVRGVYARSGAFGARATRTRASPCPPRSRARSTAGRAA